jgi:hypothetical protein
MIVRKIHDAGKKISRDLNIDIYAHGVSISIDKDPQTIVIDLSNNKLTIHLASGNGIEGPAIAEVILK